MVNCMVHNMRVPQTVSVNIFNFLSPTQLQIRTVEKHPVAVRVRTRNPKHRHISHGRHPLWVLILPATFSTFAGFYNLFGLNC